MAIWPLLTLLCVCHVSSTVTPHPGLVRRPSLVPREAQVSFECVAAATDQLCVILCLSSVGQDSLVWCSSCDV